MIAGLALALLVAGPAAAEARTVKVTFTDDKGSAVEGLEAAELVVLENGVAREVVRAEVDRRPLTLALILDTSEPVGAAFRLNLVDAVASFLSQLPDGARYTVWATGDRATRVAGPSTDRAEGIRAVQRLFPRGGNTLLDTLVEATKELEPAEGQRSAVVVVTGVDPELSYRDRQKAVDQTRGGADVFMAVQFEVDSRFEDRIRYEYVLDILTRETGGLYERPLSAMAVPGSLGKIGAELKAPYRLTYATLPELKERKLEVTVARPGVKARVWPGSKP